MKTINIQRIIIFLLYVEKKYCILNVQHDRYYFLFPVKIKLLLLKIWEIHNK